MPFHPGILTSLSDGNEDCTPKDRKAYLSIIGLLLYVSGGTRPEIAFHVNFLACFSKGPTSTHLRGPKLEEARRCEEERREELT